MLKVHVDGRVARYQRDGSIVIFTMKAQRERAADWAISYEGGAG